MALAGEDGIEPLSLSGAITDVMNLSCPIEVMQKLVQEEEAVEALDNLDIDPGDHPYLADILDPDQSGSIGIIELVDGLKRLRGEPRRSDIVTVDLMVRSLQSKV